MMPYDDIFITPLSHIIKVIFHCFLFQIGVLLGGEPNSTKAQMQEVIDFETKLANITIPSEDRRDEEKMYHQVAVAELQEIAPFVSLFLVVSK